MDLKEYEPAMPSSLVTIDRGCNAHGETTRDLPPCQYRGGEMEGRFACTAAQGAPVTPHDCLHCTVPEAVAHRDACLYLVPMRHQGEARFACRWAFSCAKDPAPKDWRHLCFCSDWFPRPPREDMISDLGDVRARYLRALLGEEPRARARPPSTTQGRPGSGERARGIRGWLRKHFKVP